MHSQAQTTLSIDCTKEQMDENSQVKHALSTCMGKYGATVDKEDI